MPYLKQGTNFLYDSTTNDIIGIKDPDSGEKYFAIVAHAGAFHSEDTQTASINTATNMEFPATDISSGITVASDTRLTVSRTGIYNVQFSAQFRNSDTAEAQADIWFRINGINVPDSNTRITIPKAHGGGDGFVVAAWNIYLTMTAGQYAEIMWSTPNTDVSIYHDSGLLLPTRPDVPSVIVTMNELYGIV